MNILNNFVSNCILENQTLKSALEQLDKVAIKVLFVTNEKKFVASLTDGDVRRSILSGALLETPISSIANYKPIYFKTDNMRMVENAMIERHISAIPIVSSSGEIIKVYTKELDEEKKEIIPLDIPVVIMAGGLGTRLYPYTKILPKPLFPIADIPISERIIKSFEKMGCNDFHMIINYKKNMIKAYFNEEDSVDKHKITFWDESIPLGTGGGLYMLNGVIGGTFILTNCDILILDDIKKIVKHHKEQQNCVTMVCSLKNFQIPYGIVNFSEGGEISSFEEKPQMSFFTNTGYYILEKKIFSYIGEKENIGMPDIIQRMKNAGEKIGIYPISENAWLDMGQFDSMESMEKRIKEINLD